MSMSGAALVFDPFPNLAVWAFVATLLAAAAAGSAFAAGGVRPGRALARLLAGALAAGALARPALETGEREALSDIAVIVADRTASQSLGERRELTDRAVAALAERAAAAGVDVRTVETGADRSRSDLLAETAAALADAPRARLGAVFLVTDGVAHDAPAPDEVEAAAARLGAPLHVVSTQSDVEYDRRVEIIRAPRYGVVGEAIEMSFRVLEEGAGADGRAGGEPITVEAFIDGRSVGRGRFPPGEEASFELPVRRPGPLVIELAADPAPGELTERNNAAVVEAEGVRDRLRVLLVSGEPHPGQRAWRNLLKSDPAVDLVHFTILRPLDKFDGTPREELALIEFPVYDLFVEKLQDFDLIIFDRYTYRNVLISPYFDNIARYVETGGALLIAAGPEFAGPGSLAARRNLAFVLPATPDGSVDETPFRPARTEIGRRHPVTADLGDETAWGRWLRTIGVAGVDGRALLENASGAPVLVVAREREGRVGLLLSDHVWLWARGYEGGGPYGELMRRLAHWLMGEPDLAEESLSARRAGAAVVVERRTLGEEPPEITLEGPAGDARRAEPEEIEPGLWRARIDPAAEGVWRARSGDLYAIAAGETPALEFARVAADPDRLRPLAEASGGGVHRADRLPTLRRARPGADARAGEALVLRRGAERIGRIERRPLVHPALAAALVLAAVGFAWALEGGRVRRAAP